MRMVVQLVYRLRRLLLRWLGWRTRGVKVMLFNPRGELLLVRNSYGKTFLHVLPGGAIGRSETPAEAALREVEEEVGILAERLAPLSTHVSRAEGKRDTVYLFEAFTDADPIADGVEVEEARFFALDALPETVSPATLRRIAEYRGERPASAAW